MITGSFPNLRLRRSRKKSWSRRLIAENNLTPSDFILPVFLTDGRNKKQGISSMPGVHRYSLDKLSLVIDKALKLKLPMIALFPYTNKKDKDRFGTEALNEENLVCKALQTKLSSFNASVPNLSLSFLLVYGNRAIIGSFNLSALSTTEFNLSNE